MDVSKMGSTLKNKIPRLFLLAAFTLSATSCHLVIGLDKKSLPEKLDGVTPCATNAECDDENDCTEDRCQLPEGVCEYFMLAAGTVCRPSQGDCDVEEQCDGSNPDCPDDSLRPATDVCRASIDPEGTCDPAEYCTGSDAACPEDVIAEPDVRCDDGDDCTYDDACDGLGGCIGVNGLSRVAYFSAAGKGTHTCALISGQEAKCWGSGNFYQLGNGTSESSAVPITVTGLPEEEKILQVSCGGGHTCVLLRSGKIMCWGRNDFGQLGIGSLADSPEPQEVAIADGFPAWDFVAAGFTYTCAIHRYGGLYCWGANERGQLGDGTTDRRLEPSAVAGLSSRALRVSAGYSHTCAVLEDGGIQCWGDDSSGQIGDETVPELTSVPTNVVGLTADALGVSIGLGHTCALLAGGEVMCWGDNGRGQLGHGTGGGGSTPVAVALPSAASVISSPSASTISSGEQHTCVLLEDGQAGCWGAGDSGQLGDGAGLDRSEPVSVTGLSPGVTAISCGLSYSCALSDIGTVDCWGSNDAGQLGNGTNEGTLVPVQVLCR